MGYRKSFKAGPIRVTASKSGISYSAGAAGARVTKRASGRVTTKVSVPGTGASFTTTAPKAAATRRVAGQRAHHAVIARAVQRVSVPVAFKGFMSTVTLHPDHVVITRTFMGKLGGNRSAVIPVSDVVQVRAHEPSITEHGYIWFATPTDPTFVTPMGKGRQGVTTNQHVVMFKRGQRQAYNELCSLLTRTSEATSRY